MDYLNILRDASLLADASFVDKFIGCSIVTILGMGITFVALLILWASIIVMSKLLAPKKVKEVTVVKSEPDVVINEVIEKEEENSEELIAVISAAVAASLNTSIHNIVVRNVVRVPNTSPAWNNAGRQEQMNARF